MQLNYILIIKYLNINLIYALNLIVTFVNYLIVKFNLDKEF